MPSLVIPLLAFAVAAVVSAAVLFGLLKSGWSARLLDLPVRANAMHSSPVPRIGGLAMACAIAVCALVFAYANPLESLLLSIAAALAAVSYLDDRRGLPVWVRLPVHLLAAMVAIYALVADAKTLGGATWLQAAIAMPLLVIAVTWITNLFNFMDGSDGMAGGMALIGFAAMGLTAADIGAIDVAATCFAISGAALGFLCFNFPPSCVFLGDAGSIPLGFLAGTLGIYGMSIGLWGGWFPLLVFSPFLVDATVTLLLRIVRRERIWQAHRSHYYQRLILAGWSHRKTALASYTLMVGAAVSATIALHLERPVQADILMSWMVLYALLLPVLEWRLRPDNKDNTK
ncbi:MAG: glycosyltransferase family 4 protein [Betaproteobacteria bacterium]|nr:glycosyltransferase family 4 protein [Betaproteobacteria bacterium]